MFSSLIECHLFIYLFVFLCQKFNRAAILAIQENTGLAKNFIWVLWESWMNFSANPIS